MAFLRSETTLSEEKGPSQVWLLPTVGGEPVRLTDLPLGAGTPAWSPDSSRIAFSAPLDPDASAPDDDAAREQRSVAAVVVDRLWSKEDGVGLLRGRTSQVYVVKLATGKISQVTAGDVHAGAPAWSPNGRFLAYPAPVAADPGLDPATAAWIIDSDGLGGPRRVGGGRGLVDAVLWSAHGDALIAVGRTDTEVGHQSLLRMPVDGGPVADLSSSLDRNVMLGGPAYPGALPQLADGGTSVVFCMRDRDVTRAYRVTTDGSSQPVPLLSGHRRSVSGLTVAADATTVAAVVATPSTPGELIAVVDGTEHALTHLMEDTVPGVEPFTTEEQTVTAPDGTEIHALILRDPLAPRPGPVLLDVHGGPHNAWSSVLDTARLYQQELVAAGWTVLLVNARGSDGYGEQFYRGLTDGWGVSDAADFTAALDSLIAEGTADPTRQAITGYSLDLPRLSCHL